MRGRVGAFVRSKQAPRAICIHIYIYICISYRASRLVDHRLDADQGIRNEEIEGNILIYNIHENGCVGGGKETEGNFVFQTAGMWPRAPREAMGKGTN